MQNSLAILIALGMLSAVPALAGDAQPKPAPPKTASSPDKVAIVSVTGCIKQDGADGWMLTNATEPEPSIANATPKKDAAPPALGKNQFKLIGVSEYNLPGVKDHTVTVKALHIKATPVDRLNLTSVVSVSDYCGGAK